MDVTGITSLATQLGQTKLEQEVSVAVLKRALDIERAAAATLLEALPPVPSANLPAHLGQNINTTA